MLSFEESLSRFILSKRYYTNDNRVKALAFEPSNIDNTTSVFRINQLDENSIWKLGEDNVSTPQNRTLYARADISVLSVISHNLNIKPDEPPNRHALIFDWPNEKHAKMAIAQELVAHATLVIKPE